MAIKIENVLTNKEQIIRDLQRDFSKKSKGYSIQSVGVKIHNAKKSQLFFTLWIAVGQILSGNETVESFVDNLIAEAKGFNLI